MRILYLLLITAANLLTAKFSPLVMAGGMLIVPIGSLFAGAVFILRDFIQLKHGRKKTYTTILGASALSAVTSVAIGDTAHVAVASVAAFFASESLDTEIFSRLRRSLAVRIMVSGILGGFIDSALFVLIGLSPLGANMLPWGQVPFAVLGQVISKTVVQIAAAVILLYHNKKTKKQKKRSKHMNNDTRETRKASYDAVRPKVNDRCRLILETLGSGEMTVSEITDRLVADGRIPYFNRNYVAPRLTELKSMGVVETCGRRRATHSSATEAVWRRTMGGGRE